MKKNCLKSISLALALVVASTPVWACTATPKANLSKTQPKPEDKTKFKEVSEASTQTTPPEATTTETPEKTSPKIQPKKEVAPAQEKETKTEQSGETATPAPQTTTPQATTPTQPAKNVETDKSESNKTEAQEINKTPKGKFVIDNFKIISKTLEQLGVSSAELDTMIKEGKNLPEVLEAKDIAIKKFKKTLLKEYYATIKQGVKDGQLTKEEGKMLKYAIKQKITKWLE